MTNQSRRGFMQSAAGVTALAITGSTAGCLEQVPLVGESSVPDTVPEDGDAVVYADVTTIIADEGVRSLTNAYLDQQSEFEYYDGPEDFEDVLSEFEDETDFEASQITEATTFFGYDDSEAVDEEYAGLRLEIDLSVEDFIDGLEDSEDSEYDEEEYGGQTVYVSEDEETWVGILSVDGTVVAGTEDAVKDTIDVANGDGDSMDEELSSAYSGSRSSPFRFAARVPSTGDDELLPAETEQPTGDGQETYDLSVFDDIQTVAGAVYRDGSLRGMAVDFSADDADTAEDLAELLGDLQSDWTDALEDAETDEQAAGDAAAILGEVTVEQNGATVTVGLEKEVDELEGLIEEYAGP